MRDGSHTFRSMNIMRFLFHPCVRVRLLSASWSGIKIIRVEQAWTFTGVIYGATEASVFLALPHVCLAGPKLLRVALARTTPIFKFGSSRFIPMFIWIIPSFDARASGIHTPQSDACCIRLIHESVFFFSKRSSWPGRILVSRFHSRTPSQSWCCVWLQTNRQVERH